VKSLLSPLVCAAAIWAVGPINVSHAAVECGRPAPDFNFTDLAGRAQKLSDYRGKIIVLEWLNPGCPVVGRHYRSGNMPATQAAAAADGAVWLQINSSAMGDLDPAKSAEWQAKQKVTATAYVRDQSGIIGRLYGAEMTPHVYVIGKDGTLVYQGAIDDQPNASQANTMSAHNYVKAALAALKAGKPIEKSSIPAYGCGVKYGSDK
jgi:peroxiredoxin